MIRSERIPSAPATRRGRRVTPHREAHSAATTSRRGEASFLRSLLLGLLLLVVGPAWAAEDANREQMKSLDEQVQEIKSDVLGIAAELSRLEEKLLYPSGTQVAVFVALEEATRCASTPCG